MNAGGSPRGQKFAAKYADLAFVFIPNDDMDGIRATVEGYKSVASAEHGKDLKMWTQVTVTCCETEAEARAIEQEVLRLGDHQAVDNMMSQMGVETGFLPPEIAEAVRDRFITGWGGPQLTGTPEMVAGRLKNISDAGLDGCIMTFPFWESGLELFRDRAMPLLEEMGLRAPFEPEATLANTVAATSGINYS
jgi:alkanesulfonate monooxygenase SsuD/methylene tetrahydromethanopterin reductase-like flavin-dependent oxidoreductase (luciferase family)